MRKFLIATMGAIFIIFAMAIPGQSHSLGYVEKQLTGAGKFFQKLDKKAPDFELYDIDGNQVTLKSFVGKIIVLYFTKADCLSKCPAQTQNMAEIQSMVNLSGMGDIVQFVAIVTDAQKDTPEVLRQFTTDGEISPSNWVFAISTPGGSAAMKQLMTAYGSTNTRPDQSDGVKNVVTHVIDTKGHLRAKFSGLNFQPTEFVIYLNALVNFGLGVSDGHKE